MKIAIIIGTRPEIIQMEPIYREIIQCNHKPLLIHTGQHYDYEMNKQFFQEDNFPNPDIHLNVKSQNPGHQTATMISRLEQTLKKTRPDAVIVLGDTNSTLAGAFASVKLHIPLLHNEAGMRSFNRKMAEEINRVCVDHISDILCTPTRTGKRNLRKEGLIDNVHLVGDVMFDSYLRRKNAIINRTCVIENLNLDKGGYNILTLHRAETVDDHNLLRKLLHSISTIKMKILFPIHPRTLKTIKRNNIKLGSNIILIRPLGYLDFLSACFHSSLILTDSGGVQKQAYFMKKRCITLRCETEWPETVSSGWNMLLGKKFPQIADLQLLPFIPRSHPAIFGTGNSSHRIINTLQKHIS